MDYQNNPFWNSTLDVGEPNDKRPGIKEESI